MTDIYLIILERFSGQHSYCMGYSLDKDVAELAGVLCEKWRGGTKYQSIIEKRSLSTKYNGYLYILEEDRNHEEEYRVLVYTEDHIQEFSLSDLGKYSCDKVDEWSFSMSDIEEMSEICGSFSNEHQVMIRDLYEKELRNKK